MGQLRQRDSRKLERQVSENTVKSIKKAYLEEQRKRVRADDGEEIAVLPTKKRGRKVLLREELDLKVQTYLRKVMEGGGSVSARIAMAAAKGIVQKCNRSLLAEFGGPIQLNRHWAHLLLKRIKFVQQKATTSKAKHIQQRISRSYESRSSMTFYKNIWLSQRLIVTLIEIQGIHQRIEGVQHGKRYVVHWTSFQKYCIRNSVAHRRNHRQIEQYGYQTAVVGNLGSK